MTHAQTYGLSADWGSAGAISGPPQTKIVQSRIERA